MIWCPVLAQIATVWLIKSSIKRMNWFIPPAHARAHTLPAIKRKTADGIKIKFQGLQTRKNASKLFLYYGVIIFSIIDIFATQMCFYSLKENQLILFGFLITISCVSSSSSAEEEEEEAALPRVALFFSLGIYLLIIYSSSGPNWVRPLP